MKECKYCRYNDETEEYEEDMCSLDFGLFGSINVSIDSENEELVFFHLKDDMGSAIYTSPIHFCPMCGRKLG